MKNQQYRQKDRGYKRQLADATNQEDPAESRKKKREDSPERDDEERVEDIGRAFTIMNLFWLTNPAKTFRTTLDTQYNPHERFENTDNKIQGQLVEIRAVLPIEYLDLDAIKESKWLRKTVSV